MSDGDLFRAVARKTGEESHEIARYGSVLSSLDSPRGPGPRHPG